MEYEMTKRPHTVGSVPKSRVHSDFIIEIIREIENEATGNVSKSKPPEKNHLKENLKRLKQIQAQAKQRYAEKQPLQPIKVPNKYSQVQSKISKEIASKDKVHAVCENIHPKTAGPYRSLPPCSPPLSIRYDNHRALQPYKSLPQLNEIQGDEQDLKHGINEMKNEDEDAFSEKSAKSFIACSKNRQKLDSKPELKHRLGHIPNYLTERKKQWELERERQLKLIEEASIPPGHSLLPDEERLETLELLKKNQEELIQSLASLPVRSDTMRLRTYKEDLERQLAKVEEGIKIFSRPKVLIKNDS